MTEFALRMIPKWTASWVAIPRARRWFALEIGFLAIAFCVIPRGGHADFHYVISPPELDLSRGDDASTNSFLYLFPQAGREIDLPFPTNEKVEIVTTNFADSIAVLATNRMLGSPPIPYQARVLTTNDYALFVTGRRAEEAFGFTSPWFETNRMSVQEYLDSNLAFCSRWWTPRFWILKEGPLRIIALLHDADAYAVCCLVLTGKIVGDGVQAKKFSVEVKKQGRGREALSGRIELFKLTSSNEYICVVQYVDFPICVLIGGENLEFLDTEDVRVVLRYDGKDVAEFIGHPRQTPVLSKDIVLPAPEADRKSLQ